MGVSIKDIADKVNVSIATVSRVLNKKNDHNITQATKQKIWNAASELHYQPNHFARALATGVTHTIGIWASQVHPFFYSNFIMQMQNAVRQSGYDALIVDVQNRFDMHADSSLGLFHWPVDGILAFENHSLVQHIINNNLLNIPIVNMGVVTWDGVDWVRIDIEDCCKQALRHLIKSGRNRIAYVGPKTSNFPGDMRHDAYLSEMNTAGLKTEDILTDVHGGGSERWYIRSYIQEYVKKSGCPDAVFCYNDEIAVGCMRGFKDISVRIPEDVAIVGCDGIDDTIYSDPPISTIEHPIKEMCETAWKFLQNRIKDSNMPIQHATLKSRLIIRQSSM